MNDISGKRLVDKIQPIVDKLHKSIDLLRDIRTENKGWPDTLAPCTWKVAHREIGVLAHLMGELDTVLWVADSLMKSPESPSAGVYTSSERGWVCPRCGRVFAPSVSSCQICTDEALQIRGRTTSGGSGSVI